MEFSEHVKKRRSIHYFTADEVSHEDLTYILEVASWAPSAGNCQPWRFIIKKSETIQILGLMLIGYPSLVEKLISPTMKGKITFED
ncbi:MAG: nitroreductase family protein [Candidatus Heimdallarchaeota archaeon]